MVQQDQVFFVGQKAFIANEKGEVLILIDPDIGLDLPGGRIQIGEKDLIASLKREVKEETELDIEVGNVFHTWVLDFPIKDKETDGKRYLVGYRCQLKEGTLKLSHEHTDYAWVSKESLKKFSPDRGHYRAVEAYFNTI